MAYSLVMALIFTSGLLVGMGIKFRDSKSDKDKAWFAETERLRRELCETKTRLSVVEPLVKELLSDKA